MEVAKKLAGRPGVQRPLVQILVVVANIQAGTLKAEVEKGFMRTAVGHESIDPKARINLVNGAIGPGPPGRPGRSPRRKGSGSTFPRSVSEEAETRTTSNTSAGAPGRVLFSR